MYDHEEGSPNFPSSLCEPSDIVNISDHDGNLPELRSGLWWHPLSPQHPPFMDLEPGQVGRLICSDVDPDWNIAQNDQDDRPGQQTGAQVEPNPMPYEASDTFFRQDCQLPRWADGLQWIQDMGHPDVEHNKRYIVMNMPQIISEPSPGSPGLATGAAPITIGCNIDFTTANMNFPEDVGHPSTYRSSTCLP